MAVSKIVSSGVVHPDKVVSTEDLMISANMMQHGFEPDTVSRVLGITHVRQADIGTMPSDLAAAASTKALKRAGIDGASIDLVIFCGIDRDCQEPATAIITSKKMGLRPRLAFDVANACAGLSSSLLIAKQFIQTGFFKNALVCTGEISSEKVRVVTHNLTKGTWGKEKADHLVGAFSVGDAGAAMIVSSEGDGVTMVSEHTDTEPEHAELCMYGGFAIEDSNEIEASMHMREICSRTISLTRRMAPEFYTKLGWESSDLKYLLQHQVGSKPYEIMAKVYNVDIAVCPPIFKELGNLTSASIPVCYEECDFTKGDKAMISSTGSGIVATQIALCA